MEGYQTTILIGDQFVIIGSIGQCCIMLTGQAPFPIEVDDR